jgi:plastocyanin
VRQRRAHVVLAVVLVPLIAACGGDDDAAGDEEIDLVDAQIEILAIDNSFEPEDATVEAGTTVTFRNVGRNDHNVVPEDDDADWKVPAESFAPSDSVTHRFTEPGEYRFYCSIHGTIDVGMPGTITVTAPGR